MWSTNSRSAHKQWVKYISGGIVKTLQGAQSPPRSKTLHKWHCQAASAFNTSSDCKDKALQYNPRYTLLQLWSFPLNKSRDWSLLLWQHSPPLYLSSSLSAMPDRQILSENPQCSEPKNWGVTWKCPEDFGPAGSSRHRYLRIPAILTAIFCYQNHTPPRLKTWVCKYSPQSSLK